MITYHSFVGKRLFTAFLVYYSDVRQCRNLTKVDAPANGGLVCHWNYQDNSQQCAVKCNKGYEFPSRVNDYERCDFTTNFTWTFQLEDPGASIPQCIGMHNYLCLSVLSAA